MLPKSIVPGNYEDVRIIYNHIYLPWYCFTANAKNAALPWCQKIDGPWLKRITRVVNLFQQLITWLSILSHIFMYLLGHIKAVMNSDLVALWWQVRCW